MGRRLWLFGLVCQPERRLRCWRCDVGKLMSSNVIALEGSARRMISDSRFVNEQGIVYQSVGLLGETYEAFPMARGVDLWSMK